MNIKFDTELVYGDNDKYIKTKIKMYGDKVSTDFQGKKIPQENTVNKCLSLIMLDFVVRGNKKYYPQTLLDNVINVDLESSPSDSETESDSDNVSDNEPKSDNETDNESDNK